VIVVYPPGNRDYRTPYPTPSGGSEAETPLPRGLFIAVAVLGLATYALSFGPVVNDAGATGWYVRFAALAALCAAFSLLSNHKPLPTVTAILAMMGFLDGMSSILMPDSFAAALGLGGLAEPGWALTVIVVLNALQATAAIAAMLLWPKASDDTATAGYEAYVEYYNQAVRNYYGQQAHSAPQQPVQRSAYGQASGDAQAAAQAHREQRAPQYGDYADFVSPQGEQSQSATAASPPAGPVAPGGMPNVAPTQPSAARQEKEADQSEWPPSP
jgi:Family of unknown function (DUF5336)